MDLPGKILITGSAGRVGQAVVQALGNEGVRGFDRVETPGLTDFIVGDLLEPQSLDRATKDIHTVIHFAATPDDVESDVVGKLFPPNIEGVYHLFEAARKNGVQRMILASSGQVVWHQRKRGPFPIGPDVVPTPRYWYAATKVFLEAAGRAYQETHGIGVLVVRLGWCPRDDKQVSEIKADPLAQDVYLSPADAGRFFACAVRASNIPFAIVYATSKPVHNQPYDMEHTRTLLGYEAEDQWPAGINL